MREHLREVLNVGLNVGYVCMYVLNVLNVLCVCMNGDNGDNVCIDVEND